MSKKELPDNENFFNIDTPDVEGAEGGWDDWDDVEDLDADVDVEPADAEEESDVEPSSGLAEAEASAAPERSLAEEPEKAPLEDELDLDIDSPAPEVDVTAVSAQPEGVPTLDAEWGDEDDWADEVEGWSEDSETSDSDDIAPAEEPLNAQAEESAPSAEIAEEQVAASAQSDSIELSEQTAQADEAATEERVQPDAAQQEAQPTEDATADVEVAENAVEAEAVAPEGEEIQPAEDASADVEVAEEPPKSEEEIAREQEELEAYRSAMGESTAEMADISDYRTFRKRTKTESTSSKPKKSDFDLFANRYKVKTMNAMVAASDPIVYFYNACLQNNGSILAFNVYQVLQDRFLGKMIPQLFTAVAENSSKIEELNEANLIEQIKTCAEFPQYEFLISISARFFTKPALLEHLLKVLPEGGVPNMVLCFDCSTLENIAIAAKAGLSSVRQRGVKVLLDNTERVTMTVLSEFDYDYIRIDSRYYEMGNPRAESYLRLLLSLAKEQGVKTIASFCDSEDLSEYMFFMGVDAVQGNAVSRPMRTVPNSVKAITLLPSMLDA